MNNEKTELDHTLRGAGGYTENIRVTLTLNVDDNFESLVKWCVRKVVENG